MRILIVEDDLTLGKLIKIALENQRYIVDWVNDDSECLSAIKSTDYEIIILDINLPDKSGIEILQIMRSLKNYTPVLIPYAPTNLHKLDKPSGSSSPLELRDFCAKIVGM